LINKIQIRSAKLFDEKADVSRSTMKQFTSIGLITITLKWNARAQSLIIVADCSVVTLNTLLQKKESKTWSSQM